MKKKYLTQKLEELTTRTYKYKRTKLDVIMFKLKEALSNDELADLLEIRLVDILEGQKLGLL